MDNNLLDPQDIINMNRNTYNAIAGQFSGTRDYLWEDLKALQKYVIKNEDVLDIGCGNGRLYQIFAESQCNYVGVDNSNQLLKVARTTFNKAKFKVAEMNKLPFEDNKFNSIWAMASFHHIPTHDLRKNTLKEITRVLKPGGRIIMLNWNMYGEWVQNKVKTEAYSKIGNHDFIVPWRDGSKKNYGDRYYHGFTCEEIEKLCVSSGLVIDEQYYIKMGESSDIILGDNLVSILHKQDTRQGQ